MCTYVYMSIHITYTHTHTHTHTHTLLQKYNSERNFSYNNYWQFTYQEDDSSFKHYFTSYIAVSILPFKLNPLSQSFVEQLLN